ncbi:hypothetical protein Fcan01_01179 [Folsomia candida]|uniref:Uncharacterized protein n=1 Tax=Folsomia candida TaxID=158441 RepID=A0A226F1J9_FOLCA|nr:hypothetical protein Fcan01_01179 [Folsomia candida]
MTTPLMFKALDVGQTVSNFISLPPVVWDISAQRLRYQVGRTQLFWAVQQIFHFVIFGLTSYIFDLAFFQFASKTHPVYMETIKSSHFVTTRLVLSLVYFGGVAFLGGIFIWGADIVSIFNTSMDLEQQLKKRVPQRPKKFDLVGTLFFLEYALVPIIPPIVALTTTLLRQDPYYTVISVLLPKWFLSIAGMRLILFAVRFTLLTAVALEIARVCIILIYGVAFGIVMCKNSLLLLDKLYESLTPEGKLDADQYIPYYQQFYLITFVTNKSCSFILLLGCGISIVMFVTFSVIVLKMWRVQSLQIYLISLFFIIAQIGITVVALPMAAEPNEASERFREKWRNSVSKVRVGREGGGEKGRYLQKRAKALNIFPLYGGFQEYRCYNLTKDVPFEYLQAVGDYTIDALLSFEV